MLVASRDTASRVYYPRHSHADTQHTSSVVGQKGFDRMFDLLEDILDRLTGSNRIVESLQWPLGKVHRHGHDIARLEVNPDKAAPLGVEGQDRRRPAKIAFGGLALEKKPLFDEVIDINP